MESSILNSIGIDPGIIVIVMMGIMIFVLLYMVRVSMKMTRFMKRYRIFMKGKDAVSLEKAFAQRFTEVDRLSELTRINTDEIRRIKEIQSRTANKIGIVKYDAFNEMGGKLSFALAMLDNNNTGWIINAMHSREGCYTYVKEIVKGESYVELAEEEAEALDKAIFEDGYEEEVDKAVASATGSLKSVKSGPAKNGNQKSTNARNTKQTSGKANNGKILNARTSNVRPDMARPEKTRNER